MFTQLIVWLNSAADAMGAIALAPIRWLPGWLSATLVAVIAGIAMLWVFKHTSNQSAILRTRNQINANLFALSLFKDNIAVSLRAQGRLLRNAGRLLALAVVPMLVMLIPMTLLLGQLAQWYEARPVPVGDETIITAQWKPGSTPPDLQLAGSPAFDFRAGPVRLLDKHQTCWRILAMQPGLHELAVTAEGQSFTKELAIGDGYLPVSPLRPTRQWSDVLLYPRERPFAADSVVQSIAIVYPERDSWTAGTFWWLVYFFVVSLVAAFVARPLLKVNI